MTMVWPGRRFGFFHAHRTALDRGLKRAHWTCRNVIWDFVKSGIFDAGIDVEA